MIVLVIKGHTKKTVKIEVDFMHDTWIYQHFINTGFFAFLDDGYNRNNISFLCSSWI
jgi:hypothetical protein